MVDCQVVSFCQGLVNGDDSHSPVVLAIHEYNARLAVVICLRSIPDKDELDL